jgi:hypothetical protein
MQLSIWWVAITGLSIVPLFGAWLLTSHPIPSLLLILYRRVEQHGYRLVLQVIHQVRQYQQVR